MCGIAFEMADHQQEKHSLFNKTRRKQCASAEFELNRSDSEADEADDESLVTVSEVQAILGPTREQIPEAVGETMKTSWIE